MEILGDFVDNPHDLNDWVFELTKETIEWSFTDH